MVVSDDVEGQQNLDEGDSDDSDDEFFKVRGKGGAKSSTDSTSEDTLRETSMLGEEDSSRVLFDGDDSFNISPWLEEGDDCLIESIRDKFVTGKWENSGTEPDEVYGDFEDFETGEKFGSHQEASLDGDDEDEDRLAAMTDDEIRAYHAEKKASQKSIFDEKFDEEKKMLGGAIGENDESAEKDYMESLEARERGAIAREMRTSLARKESELVSRMKDSARACTAEFESTISLPISCRLSTLICLLCLVVSLRKKPISVLFGADSRSIDGIREF